MNLMYCDRLVLDSCKYRVTICEGGFIDRVIVNNPEPSSVGDFLYITDSIDDIVNNIISFYKDQLLRPNF